MTDPVPLSEIWRGPMVESRHQGHAVICDAAGGIVAAWGNPRTQVYPRSSAKMIQALPLVESGAADAFGLDDARLALACASHSGAEIHTGRVGAWLAALGFSGADLRCGPQPPYDEAAHHALIRAGRAPCQIHNNCSGKHAGFLTLAAHLRAGPDYIDPGHPVQRAVLAAFEEVTGEESPGYGIDGCSAPNFITTLHGMARAMAAFASASARGGEGARAKAMVRLREAMIAHPDLVAGEGRACTELMRAAREPVALKTGAEGFYIAILPARGLGIALKVADGATRAAECTIAALLIRLGALDPVHPAARRVCNAPVLNRRGIETGRIVPAEALA